MSSGDLTISNNFSVAGESSLNTVTANSILTDTLSVEELNITGSQPSLYLNNLSVTESASFFVLPQAVGQASLTNHVVNKGYADSKYLNYADNLTQTINGVKTFTNSPSITEDISFNDVVPNKVVKKLYIDSNFVNLTTAQTIFGVKTFNEPPIISNGVVFADNAPTRAITKAYCDTNFMNLTTAQTITGSKTFTDLNATTPATSDNSTKIATTAYVKSNLSSYATLSNLSSYATLNGATFTGSCNFNEGLTIPDNKILYLNGSNSRIQVNGINITPSELEQLNNITGNIETRLNASYQKSGGDVSGNVNIIGTLNALATSLTTLASSGLATLNSLLVSNNATVNGSLTSSSLTVSGQINGGNIRTDTLRSATTGSTSISVKDKMILEAEVNIPLGVSFKYHNGLGAYMINKNTYHYPLWCSMNGQLPEFFPPNVDDYWILMPNYRITFYYSVNYNAGETGIGNINAQEKTITNSTTNSIIIYSNGTHTASNGTTYTIATNRCVAFLSNMSVGTSYAPNRVGSFRLFFNGINGYEEITIDGLSTIVP